MVLSENPRGTDHLPKWCSPYLLFWKTVRHCPCLDRSKSCRTLAWWPAWRWGWTWGAEPWEWRPGRRTNNPLITHNIPYNSHIVWEEETNKPKCTVEPPTTWTCNAYTHKWTILNAKIRHSFSALKGVLTDQCWLCHCKAHNFLDKWTPRTPHGMAWYIYRPGRS